MASGERAMQLQEGTFSGCRCMTDSGPDGAEELTLPGPCCLPCNVRYRHGVQRR